MIKLLRPFFLVIVLSLTGVFLSCQTEDDGTKYSSSSIKTVNLNDALDFVNSISLGNTNTLKENQNSNYLLEIYTELVSHEQITNTNASLTIFPVISQRNDMFSRLLLLEIDNSIEAVVFSMLLDQDSNTEGLTGELLITNVNGDFLDGYRIMDNELVSQYASVENSNRSNNNLMTYRGEECPDCPYDDCSLCGELDEVIINSDGSSGGGYIYIGTLFSDAPALCNPSLCSEWDFEGVSGDGVVSEEANPFLGADCRSFEYAKPPGALARGCAVKDMNLTFYTAGVRPNGSPYYGEIDINIFLIYFTAPVWMTNSEAANETAQAVTNAIIGTRNFFYENPDISAQVLSDVFHSLLATHMAAMGGTKSSVAPFPITSPAPYISNFFGAATDC